jgi:hypothetical protein
MTSKLILQLGILVMHTRMDGYAYPSIIDGYPCISMRIHEWHQEQQGSTIQSWKIDKDVDVATN